MNETDTPPVPTADGVTPPPSSDPVSAVESGSELEKWRALSRENEKRWKTASRELEELRQEQMTDQEKAVAQARADARREAISELATSLTEAEIRAQAASAGVTVKTEYLDLDRFLGEDGRPDTELVAQFVAGHTPASVQPEFPRLMGAGYHRGNGGTTSMDPDELVNLITGGKII